jgi:hypothetical protein
LTNESLIRAALEFPWYLRAYERWLGQRPVDTGDYLYSQACVRLRPHDDDELVVPSELSVEQAGDAVNVRIAGQQHAVSIPGLTRRDVAAVVVALRSSPTVVELPFASGVSAEACERVLAIGFGRFIFAPKGLAHLESTCSAAEIVRFPGSPYEIVRNYWINAGALSGAVERLLAQSRSSSSFVDWLRGLHVHLLLGTDLQTFYCPASPVARRRVEPGALFTVGTRTLKTDFGEFILDGPRVNATAIGGPRYNRLVDRSIGVEQAVGDSREFGASATNWGRLVQARARGETELRTWYLPPRPLSDSHWEALFESWNAALAAPGLSDAVDHLGRFHWCFVHLHPFSCANQSLAFALVNWALKRFTSSGIPHLILDQLALRHDCAEYVRLFARAVGNWTTGEAEPAARHMARVRKRQALDEFIAQLAATAGDAEADAVSSRHPQSACLALLLDTGG